MSKALRAAFHRLVQRWRPCPVGSRLMRARYRHLRAACSVGKWPRAFTARRSRALIDSIALVVQMTCRMARSNARNGTNSAQAFSQSRIMAGYRFSQVPENSAKRSSASASDAAVYTGLRSLAIAPQSLFEAYLNEFRRRCALCRRRHNIHYADLRVMPTSRRELLAAA